VLKPLWKGVRHHRGKTLAAFLKVSAGVCVCVCVRVYVVWCVLVYVWCVLRECVCVCKLHLCVLECVCVCRPLVSLFL